MSVLEMYPDTVSGAAAGSAPLGLGAGVAEGGRKGGRPGAGGRVTSAPVFLRMDRVWSGDVRPPSGPPLETLDPSTPTPGVSAKIRASPESPRFRLGTGAPAVAARVAWGRLTLPRHGYDGMPTGIGGDTGRCITFEQYQTQKDPVSGWIQGLSWSAGRALHLSLVRARSRCVARRRLRSGAAAPREYRECQRVCLNPA